MKYIDELNLENKRVLIRADLDVPLDSSGKITDDTRLKAIIETLNCALDANAKVILCGHMGRPKGQAVETLSLEPVAKHLPELTNCNCKIHKGPITDASETTKILGEREVLILENIRFQEGEEKNDEDLSRALASLADVYVNDAFATSHRKHSSTYGVAQFLSEKAAGLNIKKELTAFSEAFSNPKRPLVAIFGGAKVSSKLPAIINVSKNADKIIVGGAMANTFFAAAGHNVGKSLYEPELIETAKETISTVSNNNCELLLPTDVIVAEELKSGVPTETKKISEIASDQMALDIGPETLENFSNALNDAGTIVWNGPMGAFETPEFSSGTFGIIDKLASLTSYRIVGGGDTDSALHQKHAFDKMSYVSTAGGAFLKLLEGERLPAIEALA